MQEPDKRHILDYDGMGDFSRFPNKTTDAYVSLENEIKSSFERMVQRIFLGNNVEQVKN